MKSGGFIGWTERRARQQGSLGNIGRAVLATLWGMIGGPVLWVMSMPVLGESADAVLYALLLACAGAFAGYEASLFAFRRWSRR